MYAYTYKDISFFRVVFHFCKIIIIGDRGGRWLLLPRLGAPKGNCVLMAIGHWLLAGTGFSAVTVGYAKYLPRQLVFCGAFDFDIIILE